VAGLVDRHFTRLGQLRDCQETKEKVALPPPGMKWSVLVWWYGGHRTCVRGARFEALGVVLHQLKKSCHGISSNIFRAIATGVLGEWGVEHGRFALGGLVWTASIQSFMDTLRAEMHALLMERQCFPLDVKITMGRGLYFRFWIRNNALVVAIILARLFDSCGI